MYISVRAKGPYVSIVPALATRHVCVFRHSRLQWWLPLFLLHFADTTGTVWAMLKWWENLLPVCQPVAVTPVLQQGATTCT